MQITRISVFPQTQPLRKPYWLSGGRLKFEQLDSTFVKIETDDGITGWGEGCPWGNTYLPAFGGGVRAAAHLLAPALLGHDPRKVDKINALMDITLPGHLYAKSALDIACWDILGQCAGMPIADLLGGCHPEPTPIASSISTGTPEEMLSLINEYRKKDYKVHSVKIGADPQLDIERIRFLEANRNPGELIFYDLNRAWLPAEAIEVMNSVSNLTVIFEQPCETLDQCLTVRQKTTQPISIDENLVTLDDAQSIIHRRIGEIFNIKIGRVGGLTRARRIRDIAINAGIKFLIMDTGGGVVADTATQHLAQSIPVDMRIGTWLCQELISNDAAPGQGSRNLNGFAKVPDHCAGLGVAPDESLIGEASAVYQ